MTPMEMIFGLIEDLIDRVNGAGSPEEQEDARAELKLSRDQFIANLKGMGDNAEAQRILGLLEALSL